MPLLRLYYAYITLLLHYFEQHKYLYSALSGIVAMWCSFGIVFIEHSLWNRHDVMHLESSRCVSLGNRRDVALFLESSLWNSRLPSLNRLVKILVHVILDIGIVMRVCWTRRTTCMNKMHLWNLIENRDWINAMSSCIWFSLSFKYRAS